MLSWKRSGIRLDRSLWIIFLWTPTVIPPDLFKFLMWLMKVYAVELLKFCLISWRQIMWHLFYYNSMKVSYFLLDIFQLSIYNSSNYSCYKIVFFEMLGWRVGCLAELLFVLFYVSDRWDYYLQKGSRLRPW